ncbi:TonB-dependent receptor [Alteromonas oceanisediminis]|uniref:TonB-dependent receptor n=1 Tax=Alteromonas oceanisediminis TaxID=2836180 RepID=UPI001BDA8697|nr:TonB-dependent receptor [Alteromonas oceanisediminis]MBT0584848.1 TonB-dependent receptor [Alteromonas oceanisediminis]
MNRKIFTLSKCALLCAASFNAQANDDDADIERILVTSDFRQISVEQLAASATILDKRQLQQRQAQHLDSLLNAAPNVNFASGASRGRFVQIRGIGERSQFSEPQNASVGFEVDNIDLFGMFALASPFDIQQVEILRGPQATEFGVGALAGAIRFVGTAPGADLGNQVLLSYAQHDTWRAGFAYGDDINEENGFRVSWIEQGSDGEIDNIFLQRDDTNGTDERFGRLAYVYSPSDNASILFNYRYFDVDNSYDAFSLDNDRRTRSDEPGFDQNETHAASVKAQFDTEHVLYQFIASYATSDIAYGYDEDWTFDGFHPNGYSSFDSYFRDVESHTAELRLLSAQPLSIAGHSVDWVAGVALRQREESLLRNYTFADSDFESEYEPDNVAAYLRLDSALTERLTAQIGIRVERSTLDYRDNSGFAEESSDTLVGGKASVNYQLSTNAIVYGSVSRGYKTAGFNPDERVSDAARIYAPEYNWNYEFGAKQRFYDGKVGMRLAAFYMDREDTQINDFDVLLRDNGSTDFIDVIANASVGTNKGVEFESEWQVTDDWQIALNLGYLNATFEDYETADGSFVRSQEQAQAPRWTGHLASELFLTDNVLWRVEMDVKDDYRFSDGHDVRSPGSALLHTAIEYQMTHWQLQFWAKNVFDRDYFVRGFGGFSNDPRDGEFGYATPEPYYQFGAGRQVGVTARYSF